MSASEFRVYISTALGDLAEERDYLHETIFPELAVLCREQGIAFTAVDLRYGLDAANESPDDLIPLCFDGIDRCRPYFIGLYGRDYGHIPELTRLRRQPELIERYPWLEDAAADEMSIMEMECRYGVLNPEWYSPMYDTRNPRRRGGSALFYFRRRRLSDAYEREWGNQRVEMLQDDLREAGAPIAEFRDHEMLGELIYHDLIGILRRDFTAAQQPTPLDEERALHQAYARSLSDTYIPNPGYLRRLNEHALDDRPPLVVYAESGSGKTALTAYWVGELRRENPEAFVVEHFVAASGGDDPAIIRHLMLEIRDRYNLERDIPQSPDELREQLPAWLELVVEERLIVAIDGVNLLQGPGQGLGWLPRHIPSNVRMVVTTTVEHSLVVLRERGWQQMGMQPMSVAFRQAVVARFLDEHRLTLPMDLLTQIPDDPKSASPLYLRVVLEELRRSAAHSALRRRIASYLEVTGIDDLFQRLLDHIEEDFGADHVAEVMMLVWGSRTGLSPDELVGVSSLSQLFLARLKRNIGCYFIERDGRLTFFHDYLRRAVDMRYVAAEEEKELVHTRLADYFETQAREQLRIQRRVAPVFAGRSELPAKPRRIELPQRYVVELGYQRRQVDLLRHLRASREPLGIDEDALMSKPEEAESEAVAPHEAAATVIAEKVTTSAGIPDDSEVPAAEEKGVDSSEETDVDENAAASEAGDDASDESDLPGNDDLSIVAAAPSPRRFDIGRLVADAEGLIEIAERLRTASERYRDETSHGVPSRVVGEKSRPTNGASRSEERAEHHSTYPEALERFIRHIAGTQSEETASTRDTEHERHRPASRHGDVHRLIGCFLEDLEDAEEEGDAEGMAESYCDLGIVYTMEGDNIRGRECFGAALNIAEEINERRLIALASGNLGVVCYNQGEYVLAVEHLRRELDLSRDAGEAEGVSVSLGNLGIVYADQSEYNRALECFAEQFAIDEERGDSEGMSVAIGNMGNVYRRRGEYRQVLRCFRTAIENARGAGASLAIGHWLLRMAQTFVELVRASDPPPAYLAPYVRLNDREVILEEARDYVNESIECAESSYSHNLLFEGRLLLAAIDHARGAIRSAEEQLLSLLHEARDDDERASAHYELWRLGSFVASGVATRQADHASEAVRLYQTLYAQAPRLEYGRRIVELKSLRRQPLHKLRSP